MPFPYLTSRLSTVTPNPSTAYDQISLGFDSLFNQIKIMSTLEVSCPWRASLGWTSDSELVWLNPTVRFARLATSPNITPTFPLFTFFCSCLKCPPANWRPIVNDFLYYIFKNNKKLQLINTRESNEKTENVVRSFKNTKDSQITQNFFQSVGSHESISAQNLNKMMRKLIWKQQQLMQ